MNPTLPPEILLLIFESNISLNDLAKWIDDPLLFPYLQNISICSLPISYFELMKCSQIKILRIGKKELSIIRTSCINLYSDLNLIFQINSTWLKFLYRSPSDSSLFEQIYHGLSPENVWIEDRLKGAEWGTALKFSKEFILSPKVLRLDISRHSNERPYWFGTYAISKAREVRIPEYDGLDDPYNYDKMLPSINPVEELLIPIDRCSAFLNLEILRNSCPNLKKVAVTCFDNCCEVRHNNPLKGVPFLEKLSAKLIEYDWDAYVIINEFGPRFPPFPKINYINENEWDKKCGIWGEDLK